MNGIRSYVAQLCAITFLIATVNAVAPKNNAAKVCSMLAGILLIAVLVSPFRKLDVSVLSDMENRYGYEAKNQISEMTEKYSSVEKRIIEERLLTYVLNEANVDKDECSIKIELRDNIPVSAVIYTSESKTYAAVSQVLERDLRIPEENIKKEEK